MALSFGQGWAVAPSCCCCPGARASLAQPGGREWAGRVLRAHPALPGTPFPVPGCDTFPCPNAQPAPEHLCLCKRSRNSQPQPLSTSSPAQGGSSPTSPAQPLNSAGTNLSPSSQNIPNIGFSLLLLVPRLCSSDSPEGGTEILQVCELVLPEGNKNRFSHLFLLNQTNQAQLIAPKQSQSSPSPEWERVIEVIQTPERSGLIVSCWGGFVLWGGSGDLLILLPGLCGSIPHSTIHTNSCSGIPGAVPIRGTPSLLWSSLRAARAAFPGTCPRNGAESIWRSHHRFVFL